MKMAKYDKPSSYRTVIPTAYVWVCIMADPVYGAKTWYLSRDIFHFHKSVMLHFISLTILEVKHITIEK